jgi:predicted nucleotidyltransferase
VRRLSLFGSILRDDFGPDSDVDVLVEFLPTVRASLFDLGC